MLDYRGLEALYTIFETQSFEVAAKQLNISQSAISQRLKALQNLYSDPLLKRTKPYTLSKLGIELISHYKKVHSLELNLKSDLKNYKQKTKISLAISRDSLETWFLPLITRSKLFNSNLVEVIANDQELTIEYLRQGLVNSCFATQKKSVAGCNVEFIGNFNYILVATNEFKKEYFTDSNIINNLIKAPTLIFDKNDKLLERFIYKHFNTKLKPENFHTMPSVRGFKEMALQGLAYGLIPEIDIKKELQQKKLIRLLSEYKWIMPVYFHYWNIDDIQLQKTFKNIITVAKKALR